LKQPTGTRAAGAELSAATTEHPLAASTDASMKLPEKRRRKLHSTKMDYIDDPVSTQDNTTGIHLSNVTIFTKLCILSGTVVKAQSNLHGSDMRSIF
jgi:hypothetical protein